MEFARLVECVATRGGIDHEQRLMRGIRIEFAESAFHLLELGQEIRFGVLTTSRVAKQKVDFVLRGRLIGVVTKRSRVGAVLAANHFNAESLCPDIKLLDRSSAKSVGCFPYH